MLSMSVLSLSLFLSRKRNCSERKRTKNSAMPRGDGYCPRNSLTDKNGLERTSRNPVTLHLHFPIFSTVPVEIILLALEGILFFFFFANSEVSRFEKLDSVSQYVAVPLFKKWWSIDLLVFHWNSISQNVLSSRHTIGKRFARDDKRRRRNKQVLDG